MYSSMSGAVEMLIIYDLASLPLLHVHVLIFVFLCSNRETIPNTLLVNYVWIPFIHHGVSRDSLAPHPLGPAM